MTEQENNYSHFLIEASHDPLLILDASGCVLDLNQAALEMLGAPGEENLGKTFTSYFTEPEIAKKAYLDLFKLGV